MDPNPTKSNATNLWLNVKAGANCVCEAGYEGPALEYADISGVQRNLNFSMTEDETPACASAAASDGSGGENG